MNKIYLKFLLKYSLNIQRLNKTSAENQNQKNKKNYGETKIRSLFTRIRIFDYKTWVVVTCLYLTPCLTGKSHVT